MITLLITFFVNLKMITLLITFFVFACGYFAAAVDWTKFLRDAFTITGMKH